MNRKQRITVSARQMTDFAVSLRGMCSDLTWTSCGPVSLQKCTMLDEVGVRL